MTRIRTFSSPQEAVQFFSLVVLVHIRVPEVHSQSRHALTAKVHHVDGAIGVYLVDDGHVRAAVIKSSIVIAVMGVVEEHRVAHVDLSLVP